jgi:nucleoside-diphosphate-sugar epimerase
MRRFLITGATGFVGSYLARYMVEAGYDVHIFTRRESNKWRINDLIGRLTDHEVDLRDALTVETLVRKIRPTIIYHFATYGGFSFQNDTSSIIESNLMGTVNLLKACEQVGFECFVNTGSSSEYGIKSESMKEYDILEPLGDYGVSKAAATLFCKSEAMKKNLPVTTIRLFSPYGKLDDPKRLIPYVIKSLLRGESPKLSTPNSVRDYIFIDDVLDFYLKITNQPLVGEIFNIGSGIQTSIGEVVSTISDIIGNGIEPVWGAIERSRTEPNIWVADITKANSYLNWNPTITTRVGLERTVDWINNNMHLYP